MEVVEEPREAPASSWVLVAQFFVVPVVIVALCVGIFLLFGLITGESRGARDYLDEVKAGSGNRRWQAAFELSKFVGDKRAKVDPRFGRDLAGVFRGAKEDPKVRQYLALAMGRLGDPVAVDTLVGAVSDRDPDTRLYVVWSLGQLRDARALEPLLAVVEGNDPNLRKMAIYSLGMIGDARAVAPLKAALNDPRHDIRWNSALALARLRDPSGIDTLHQMLDRRALAALPEATEPQRSEAIINAARAVGLLKDVSARPLLEAVRDTDPDVKARSAAISALKEIP
jgi:hypothetical protein